MHQVPPDNSLRRTPPGCRAVTSNKGGGTIILLGGRVHLPTMLRPSVPPPTISPLDRMRLASFSILNRPNDTALPPVAALRTHSRAVLDVVPRRPRGRYPKNFCAGRFAPSAPSGPRDPFSPYLDSLRTGNRRPWPPSPPPDMSPA